MAKETQGKTTAAKYARVSSDVRTGLDCESLKQAVHDHLRYSVARLPRLATTRDYYRALALAVRDRMQQRWAHSAQTYFDLDCKLTAYLSAEFLV